MSRGTCHVRNCNFFIIINFCCFFFFFSKKLKITTDKTPIVKSHRLTQAQPGSISTGSFRWNGTYANKSLKKKKKKPKPLDRGRWVSGSVGGLLPASDGPDGPPLRDKEKKFKKKNNLYMVTLIGLPYIVYRVSK
jgi:hypothetical protein